MSQIFSVFYLMFLQSLSLMLTAFGSCFQSAGSFAHVTFVRSATRHDIKYGMTEAEKVAALGEKHGAPANPKWTN